MFLKKENLYLFLALILIISTNIYLSCKLVENTEGIMKKVKNFFEKEIKNTLIKKPIKAIPLKPLRRFFLSRINFKKSLFKVIMQLILAIIQAAMIIMVLVPVFTVAIMLSVGPLFTLIVSMGAYILKLLFKKPVSIPNSMSGASRGMSGGIIPQTPKQVNELMTKI